MNWIPVTRRPEPADRVGGQVVRWYHTPPAHIQLDLVAAIEPVTYNWADEGEIDGSRIIWHGSSPRTEWVVKESPATILNHVAIHAEDCDMGEDCSCGANDA